MASRAHAHRPIHGGEGGCRGSRVPAGDRAGSRLRGRLCRALRRADAVGRLALRGHRCSAPRQPPAARASAGPRSGFRGRAVRTGDVGGPGRRNARVEVPRGRAPRSGQQSRAHLIRDVPGCHLDARGSPARFADPDFSRPATVRRRRPAMPATSRQPGCSSARSRSIPFRRPPASSRSISADPGREAAESQLEALLAIDPDFYPALQRLAKYRWWFHDSPSQAIALIERAIAADPQNPLARQHSAVAFYLDIDDAMAAADVAAGNARQRDHGHAGAGAAVPATGGPPAWRPEAGELRLRRFRGVPAIRRRFGTYALRTHDYATAGEHCSAALRDVEGRPGRDRSVQLPDLGPARAPAARAGQHGASKSGPGVGHRLDRRGSANTARYSTAARGPRR